MGCDIHVHTEVKINGTWHHYGEPRVQPNHRLFAKMGDVRNDGDIVPLSKNRGVPDDASELTKFCSYEWGADGHSHSFLNSSEIEELLEFCKKEGFGESDKAAEFWFESQFGYFFEGPWQGFYQYVAGSASGTPSGVEDVRFVFWFDN